MRKSPRTPKCRGSISAVSLRVERVPSGESWAFVHPRCARDRQEDLEEVRGMIKSGEVDVAIDELRWLLSGCSELLAAHVLLGRLALVKDQDVPLARGHFGIAYDLGLKALRRCGMPKPLLYRIEANQPFFDAGRGLATCFERLGRPEMSAEILRTLLACDPGDPLGLRSRLEPSERVRPKSESGERLGASRTEPEPE
jgi:hypothetical protein